MNFALLVSNLPGVYHVQPALQVSPVAGNPLPSAIKLKRMISRLLAGLQNQ